MADAEPISDTHRLGLLMEAAQAQQRLGEEALGRLAEHMRGIDEVVREEVAHAITDSLCGLRAETQEATAALRRLRRSADLRLILWSFAVTGVSLAVGLAVVRALVPTHRQIETLRSRRAALESDIRRLSEFGGSVDLKRCGRTARLCVRVRRAGPAYGPDGQFLLIAPP